MHLTVQPAFTLLPDCSEQAAALARLADQGDHIRNSFRTSKRTCPHCRSTEIYGRRPRWVAQIGNMELAPSEGLDMNSSSGQVGMAFDT